LTNNQIRYQNRNSANLALVILVLLVLGCSCQKLGDIVNNASEKESNTHSNSTPPPRSESSNDEHALTMANYEKIKTGMLRSDVEDLLGGKGTEVSSSSGGGMTFTVVKWEGADFKSIILTFRNDKVMAKTQVGLK
jgi:hypothetical protein